MYKTNELDINYFVQLAKEKVGYIGDLEFQSFKNEKAGKFEILNFEKVEDPTFTFSYWRFKEADTPNGAILGTYTIKLTDTKFYNGKTFEFEVHAYVQNENGLIDMLFINNVNLETGKQLKAYKFPLLNSIYKQ